MKLKETEDKKIYIVPPGHGVEISGTTVSAGQYFKCSEAAALYHVRNGHARSPLPDEVPAEDSIIIEIIED